MTKARRTLIIVFGTVQRVMRAERAARSAGLDVDAVPAPRAVSSECGVVLEARTGDGPALRKTISELGFTPDGVYRLLSGTWTPSSLDATDSADVRLTEHTAYGGCGAKLSKGLLSSILCGLPRIESADLIVGIDTADDAGVVRISDDLAIIHTTDFFPPMVDDPFAFGRIAAANALSDVYAMGGTPLAGMNLVSFPLAHHAKSVLKEILRGGLSALQEADALLAGGHTIEGAELLYGLAVTGTVHPEKIWRNGGAQPGDSLVLTKPLGTGLVTTAAKAGLAEPTQVATAMRWMSTLNNRAADVLRSLSPRAVTDITGFGLVGHAAEMADASAVQIDIMLNKLPHMPGAIDAARSGCVPVGAAKNLSSVDVVLEIAADADPLLVDLALDPQTSGGLLAALPPDEAEDLCRRAPAAAIVGQVTGNSEGLIRLI